MAFLKDKNAQARLRSRSTHVTLAVKCVRIFVHLLLLAILCAFIWYVVRFSIFSIARVEVKGGETISHDEITRIVESQLKGTYVLLIPKAFKYLYPKNNIIAEIERDERIYDVDIQITAENTLIVTFEEYLPEALWCLKDTEYTCYFLDSTGFAFATAPQLKGGTFVRYTFTWKDRLERGYVLDSVSYISLNTFIKRLHENLHIRISEVVYDTHDDVTLFINGGGKILLSAKKDYNETFNNIATLLNSTEFKYLTPGNFDYIDVRFDNKVFLNEQTQEPATTTVTTTTF